MKLIKSDLESIRRWIYRNARPLDLARWQYYFEGGSAEAVLQALAAYQNEDGGFGHALEADCWNPESAPMQTWTASCILREVGAPKGHPVAQGILRYLGSGAHFVDGLWQGAIPSNNDFPHAPWWTFTERSGEDWGYNPTASLAGFILQYDEPGSALYQKGEALAKHAAADFIAGRTKSDDMHEVTVFWELLACCKAAGRTDLFDEKAYEGRLKSAVRVLIGNDPSDWTQGYVCTPSRFIRSPQSPFYPGSEGLPEQECDLLIQNRNAHGVWNLTWTWGAYEREFAISENWWKANLAIQNLLFLRAFGRIEG